MSSIIMNRENFKSHRLCIFRNACHPLIMGRKINSYSTAFHKKGKNNEWFICLFLLNKGQREGACLQKTGLKLVCANQQK